MNKFAVGLAVIIGLFTFINHLALKGTPTQPITTSTQIEGPPRPTKEPLYIDAPHSLIADPKPREKEPEPLYETIQGSGWFGCQNKSDFEIISKYLYQKDIEAADKAIAFTQGTGSITFFKDGEDVFIQDYAFFSGLVKVRRRGQLTEYWTNREAVIKPK